MRTFGGRTFAVSLSYSKNPVGFPMISIEKVENKYDKKELRDLIEAHVEATGSKLGAKVLADFDYYLPHFKKLIPNEYKKMITLSAKLEEKGLNSQQAQMEAFYESIGAKN